MDLLNYLGCFVHIKLKLDSFYYRGKVISADSDSITLIDLKGRKVTLDKDSILTIEEVIK